MAERFRANPEMEERARRLAFAIRQAIDIRGLTPEQVAKRINRSSNTVARWAKGTTIMTILDIKPLSDALGVTYDFFSDPPEVPNYPIEVYLVENQSPK